MIASNTTDLALALRPSAGNIGGWAAANRQLRTTARRRQDSLEIAEGVDAIAESEMERDFRRDLEDLEMEYVWPVYAYDDYYRECIHGGYWQKIPVDQRFLLN